MMLLVESISPDLPQLQVQRDRFELANGLDTLVATATTRGNMGHELAIAAWQVRFEPQWVNPLRELAKMSPETEEMQIAALAQGLFNTSLPSVELWPT